MKFSISHQLKTQIQKISLIWWYFRYSLVLITMLNVGDLVGRYIPLLQLLKLESRKGLMIAVLSRFLLIPAFYFTVKYGDQGWMIILTSFLGLANGYLTVCVVTSAPEGYKVCSLCSTCKLIFNRLKHLTKMNLIGFCCIGTRAKCLGKFARLFSLWWYICWRCAWLAVADRQRMVSLAFSIF